MISTGKDNAILVYDKGKGSFVSCEIRGEAAKPIELNDGCAPLLHACTIIDGKKENVLRWLKQIPRNENGDILATYPEEPEVVQSDDGEFQSEGNPAIQKKCKKKSKSTKKDE